MCPPYTSCPARLGLKALLHLLGAGLTPITPNQAYVFPFSNIRQATGT